jgi:MFS family permease
MRYQERRVSHRNPVARRGTIDMRALYERHRFILAFVTLSAITGSSVGLAKVTTSLYAVHLGAHEALLGLIASSQSLGVLLMSLPLGFLVERHGPARLFVTGTLIAGMLYTLVPVLPIPGFLLVCTTAIGFFMPFRFVALNTIFLEQLLTLGEAKAGWYRGTHMAGMFLIGPLLAASVIKRFQFAGTFWLIGAAFALTIALSPIVFRQYRARERSSERLGWRELRGRLGLLLRDPELRRVGVVEMTAQAIHGFYSFFIVVIGVTALGLSRSDAASLVAAQGCTYVFSLIALGGVATRLGTLRVHMASCTGLVISLLVLGVGSRLAVLWAGALLLGASLGLLQIVNLTRFAHIGARIGRGQTAGINALVGPAGGFAGSLLGGALGRGLGLQTVFLLFIPVVGLLGWQLSQSVPELQLET